MIKCIDNGTSENNNKQKGHQPPKTFTSKLFGACEKLIQTTDLINASHSLKQLCQNNAFSLILEESGQIVKKIAFFVSDNTIKQLFSLLKQKRTKPITHLQKKKTNNNKKPNKISFSSINNQHTLEAFNFCLFSSQASSHIGIHPFAYNLNRSQNPL